jgi:hypothetical protein
MQNKKNPKADDTTQDWQNDPVVDAFLASQAKPQQPQDFGFVPDAPAQAPQASPEQGSFMSGSTVSGPELSRESTAKNPQYVSAALTGPANQALSLMSGPGQNAALTAMPGKVPYFVKRPGQGPELMDVARLKKGESKQGVSRGLRQIRAAVGGINPLGELLHEPYHVEAPFPLSVLERPIPGVRPFGSIYSQSYERRKSR